jgi:hypothetical protein
MEKRKKGEGRRDIIEKNIFLHPSKNLWDCKPL